MAEMTTLDVSLARLLARGAVVKICGLREPEHAAAAAGAGADLIGFIFAPARRQVTAAAARACIAAARDAAPERTVLAVGVFVDAPPAEMRSIVEEAKIDVIQLHGDEPPDSLQHLPVPVVKALRPRSGTDAAHILGEINRYRSSPRAPLGILVDGYAEEGSGGTGARADWRIAKEVGAVFPILLGGGLDSRNVSDAIRQVGPIGVDVSSGVEVKGIKSASRIDEFIRAARQAFQHPLDWDR